MKEYTKEGREYVFCHCGLVVYDGLNNGKCDRHINKDKPKERKGKIFFIHAAEEYESLKKQNKLRDQDLEKISGALKKYKDMEKYCRVVDVSEIAENDYNLNISRYIDTTPEEEEIDVKAAVKELHEIEDKRKVVEDKMNKYLKELGL